ncbi:MAG TPA: MFS transporter [Stellaceae bacterium]|nr:MFS transporter [Stellaceae bacterium]
MRETTSPDRIAAPDHKPTPRSRWFRIGPLIFLAYLACYVDRNNISVAAPDMMRHFGMTGVGTGVLLSAFFWGYVVMQIPGGWIASRFGPKWVIVGCLLGVSVTGVLTGVVENYRALLAIRFLMGLAEGVIWPSFAVIIMRWFPSEERGRAVNLAQYVLPLSSTLMAPVSGWMISAWSWEAMFILQALPVLVLALAWIILGSSDPTHDRRISEAEKYRILATRDQDTGQAGSFFDVFRRPVVWGLCLAYFLWLTGLYGFGLWLPSLIRQISSTGISSAAELTAIPYAFAILGLFLNVYWADRAKHARALHFIVPLAIGGVSMLLQNQLAPGLVMSMVLLVITGVSLFCGIGVWWAWALGMAPRNQIGPSAGLINFFGNFGGIVGPIVVGAAAGSGSPAGSFHVVGYALLASAAVNTVVWLSSYPSAAPAKAVATAD